MIANHKGEIPAVVLLLPFLAGTGIGLSFVSAAYLTALVIAFICLFILFITLNLNYLRFNIYKQQWVGGLIISLLLLLAGWIRVISHNELNDSRHFSKSRARYLVVHISNEPQLKNGLLRFTVAVDQTIGQKQAKAAAGTLLITLKDTAANLLNYGDELLIPATYNPVYPPFNPAEFNYKNYLEHQNIYYQAFLYGRQYIVLKHDTGNPLIAGSLKLRRQLVEKFRLKMHDPDAIAVASTLILGYKADLSEDVLQAYSKTGTIHALSVSGAHVAIIWGLLQVMLAFLDRYRYGKLVKAAAIILLIWYYAMLTGFSPAVCRAALMISMVITGKTCSRYINSLNILAISAFLLLLYNPLFITDAGFQLSYLAVAGIIVLQPVVYKWVTFKHKWAGKLWALCSVSIAAQVITFPLSAFYFHQFPVYFLLGNLFIILPVAIIMYSGLAYLVCSAIPVVSTMLAYVLEKSILLMNHVLARIEHAPFASISKIWINPAEYLLMYVLIISLFYFLYHKNLQLLKLCLACAFLLSLSFSLKKYRAGTTRSIVFLNMRKNTGIIFKNGTHAIIISNLDDTDRNYEYTIQPCLDSSITSDEVLCPINKNISCACLQKQGNLIQFFDKRIVLFDKRLQDAVMPQKIKTDYIYITGSPHANLAALSKNFNYQMLIIDAANTPKTVTDIERQAKLAHIKYTVLKRNNSLILASN